MFGTEQEKPTRQLRRSVAKQTAICSGTVMGKGLYTQASRRLARPDADTNARGNILNLFAGQSGIAVQPDNSRYPCIAQSRLLEVAQSAAANLIAVPVHKWLGQ
jgi:hypothetical protein